MTLLRAPLACAFLVVAGTASAADERYGASSAEISVLEAEQARQLNERKSLEQQRRYETERDRLYHSRQQREQRRLAAGRERTRGSGYTYAPLPFASDAELAERRRERAQDRFVEFYDFVRPALERDDFEAVKFAAEQMRILPEGTAFTRDYYDKLRALLPDAD